MIAFINNTFPGLSSKFIYKEVLLLKALGVNIKTYSIRKPNINDLSQESKQLYIETEYLIPVKYIKLIIANLYYLCRFPIKCLFLIIHLMSQKYENIFKDRKRTILHIFEGIYLSYLIKKDKNITHIHAHYASHPATLAYVVSELLNISFSITAHAYDIWEDRLIIEEKIKKSKFVITCSEYGKYYINNITNYKYKNKIFKIYHGVDVEMFKCKERTENEVFYILNIGRLHEEKGHIYLIRACEILIKEGYKIKCDIIGDGEMFNYLNHEIKKRDIEKYVTLVGKVFQENVVCYYNKADIFVLTSLKENLPNVLVESLSMGVPVVAPNIAGIPELIVNNQNGILFEKGNVNNIVESIKILYNDNNYRKRLSINGRRLIEEKFNQNNLINDIISIYKQYNVV